MTTLRPFVHGEVLDVVVKILVSSLAGLAAFAAAALATIAIVQPTDGWPYRYVPDPLVGLGAAVVIVLLADVFLPRWPRAWGLVGVAALAAAVAAACAHASGGLSGAFRGADGRREGFLSVSEWILLLAMVLAGAFAAASMTAFARDSRRNLVKSPINDILPLPSQEAFADQVVQRCLSPDPTGFKLVPLVGRWGDGKSYILSVIETDLMTRGIGVVRLNVWQSETDPTFYESIVRNVYGTTGFLRRLGWLRRPIGLTLFSARRWRPTLLKLGVASSSAELTLHHLPPTLPYVASLSRDLRARQRAGAPSLVIIVDEIDRATSVAAQSVLTVLRRAFDVPGVVVLVSFVEEHVHFNTFNPERGMLDDLRGAFMSIVSQERTFETHSGQAADVTPGGEERGLTSTVERIRASDLLVQISTHEPDGTATAERRPRATDRVQEVLSIEADLDLLAHYTQWSDAKKAAVQRRAAEKFLHGGAMRTPRLTPEDVSALVVRADGYREVLAQAKADGSAETTRLHQREGEVCAAVTEAVAALAAPSLIVDDGEEPPPIRHLRSCIDQFLPRLAAGAARGAEGTEPRHIGLAAAALYRAAQLKAGA